MNVFSRLITRSVTFCTEPYFDGKYLQSVYCYVRNDINLGFSITGEHFLYLQYSLSSHAKPRLIEHIYGSSSFHLSLSLHIHVSLLSFYHSSANILHNFIYISLLFDIFE
jgi:hypothetical protein